MFGRKSGNVKKLSQDGAKGFAKKQAKRVALKVLIAAAPYIGMILLAVVAVSMIVAIAAPFMKAFATTKGLFSKRDKAYIEKIVQQEGPDGRTIKAMLQDFLGCKNASEEDRKAGYCIEEEAQYAEESPIPADKQWLLPVWQAAANKYGVPWQLLAAVAAARTEFGDINCSFIGAKSKGLGFYRLSAADWNSAKADMGSAEIVKTQGANGVDGAGTCYDATGLKDGWKKKDGKADPYDPVDATFALAKLISANPKFTETIATWGDYNGSSPNGCKCPAAEGPIYQYVSGTGEISGNAGWNEKVQLSNEALALGLKYTAAEWNAGQGDFPQQPGSIKGEKLNPSDVGAANGYTTVKSAYVPKGDAAIMIRAALRAIKVPEENYNIITLGMLRQIYGNPEVGYPGESGGWANAVQSGKLADGNQAYPNRARGIIQFVPSTFTGWRIPGYDNIFNPVHTITAAVNAQRNSTSSISRGSFYIPSFGWWLQGYEGWGPRGSNPYAGTRGSRGASTVSIAAGDSQAPLKAAAKPVIVQKPIPFGAARRQETAAYAKRHYGVADWRLQPQVIVEHYTGTDTFEQTYNTFASDRPDRQSQEAPGPCAQFVVDTDGTIYQLVPLDVICPHTVGLNDVAIGIEMVGQSEAEILARPEQKRAAIQLTRWLMSEYTISVDNVIGHNESLTSPLFHEKVARFSNQTGDDWTKANMDKLRAELRKDGGGGTSTVYSGSKPTDTMSKIVGDLFGVGGKPASSCQIATIYEWYQAILANPPGDKFAVGGTGKLAGMIEAAMSQIQGTENGNPVGQKEVTPNDGPMIKQYLASVGFNYPTFWCAAFLSWAAQRAGLPLGPDGRGSASVQALSEWAMRPDVNIWAGPRDIKKPKPGDLIVYYEGRDSYSHMGMVINSGSPLSTSFTTIEGNAGDAVRVLTRDTLRDNITGYVQLSKRFGSVDGVIAPGTGGIFNDNVRTR